MLGSLCFLCAVGSKKLIVSGKNYLPNEIFHEKPDG